MDKEAPTYSHVLDILRTENPTQNLVLSVEILDQIEQAKKLDTLLSKAVDEALELNVSEQRALHAVTYGAETLDDVSEQLGLVEEATSVVIDSLINRNFVVRAEDKLFVTEIGRATCDRAEAIRYRAADLASTQLTPDQLQNLSLTLQRVRQLSSGQQLPQA